MCEGYGMTIFSIKSTTNYNNMIPLCFSWRLKEKKID